MKAKINATLISRLTPQDKAFEVYDTQIKGFTVRVLASGVKSYNLVYKNIYGERRRYAIGLHGNITPDKARTRASILAGEVSEGIDIQALKEENRLEGKRRASRMTLQEFIEGDYKEWCQGNKTKGNAPKVISHIKSSFADFLDHYLEDFNNAMADKWRTERRKAGASVATVNSRIAELRAALTKAVEWKIIKAHPLTEFKLLRSDKKPLIRYLSAEEEQCLRQGLKTRDQRNKEERASANEWRKERNVPLLPDMSRWKYSDHLTPMVLLSINTGLRRGEVFNLEWKDIDFKTKILTVVGSKAKSLQTRHIPLNSEALSVLEAWREQTNNTDLVFPSKDNQPFDNVKTAWTNLLKEAVIEKFRWHDMRHHFASSLVMAGVDLNTVRELLGHSDIKMTLRYAHLAPEHKAKAVELICTK